MKKAKSKIRLNADAVARTVQCTGCATDKHHKHNGAILISPYTLQILLVLTNK